MGLLGPPDTSANSYQHMLHNNLEDHTYTVVEAFNFEAHKGVIFPNSVISPLFF
jgi:hypothetical protein